MHGIPRVLWFFIVTGNKISQEKNKQRKKKTTTKNQYNRFTQIQHSFFFFLLPHRIKVSLQGGTRQLKKPYRTLSLFQPGKHIAIPWEDRCFPNKLMVSSAPTLSPPLLLLLSRTSCTMEYSFGQFRSAVSAVSSLHLLPTPNLMAFAEAGIGGIALMPCQHWSAAAARTLVWYQRCSSNWLLQDAQILPMVAQPSWHSYSERLFSYIPLAACLQDGRSEIPS